MKNSLFLLLLALSSALSAQTVTYVMSDYFAAATSANPLAVTLDEGLTLQANKNGGQTKPAYLAAGYFCVYAKGSLTIACTDTITQIIFGSCDMAQLASLSATTGQMTQDVATNPIWNGATKEVTFTVSDKAEYSAKSPTKAGQLKFMTLTITFGAGPTPVDPTDTVFTKAVDYYYGTYAGEGVPANKYYNHQLWFTTQGLTFDGEGIEGTDGRSMHLDLFSASATDITGTYTIVDPIKADAPGCINKKFSYYAYFQSGSFYEQKLTVGTCTISCVTSTTYDIAYDVTEINNGARHQGLIQGISISVIPAGPQSTKLSNSCAETEIKDITTTSLPAKRLENGQLILHHNGHDYSLQGQIIK